MESILAIYAKKSLNSILRNQIVGLLLGQEKNVVTNVPAKAVCREIGPAI